MTTRLNEYECAVSGNVAEAGLHDETDGLGDMPVGWTQIRMTRRQYNPKWVFIQQVKEAMMQNLLSQFPAEVAEAQRMPLLIQVEAQFHSLEKDTPVYTTDIEDVVYLSDKGDVIDSLNEVRELLGLEPVEKGEEEADEEEEAEEVDEQK